MIQNCFMYYTDSNYYEFSNNFKNILTNIINANVSSLLFYACNIGPISIIFAKDITLAINICKFIYKMYF